MITIQFEDNMHHTQQTLVQELNLGYKRGVKTQDPFACNQTSDKYANVC